MSAMVVVAVLGNGFLGLQVYKSYSSKEVEGISMLSYIALSFGYVFWILYGSLMNGTVDIPVVVGSSVGLALAISIIVAISMYGENVWSLT